MRSSNPGRVRGWWTPHLEKDENQAHYSRRAGTSSYLLGVRASCRRVFHPAGRRVTQSNRKRILARKSVQETPKFSTVIHVLTHRIISCRCLEYLVLFRSEPGKGSSKFSVLLQRTLEKDRPHSQISALAGELLLPKTWQIRRT